MSYSDSLDNITLDSDDILTIERFENNYYNHKNNVLQIGGVYTIEQINEKLQTIFTNILELIFRKIDFKELIFSKEFEEDGNNYIIEYYHHTYPRPEYSDHEKYNEYEKNRDNRIQVFRYVLDESNQTNVYPNLTEYNKLLEKDIELKKVLQKNTFNQFKLNFLKDKELEYEIYFERYFDKLKLSINPFKKKVFKEWKQKSIPEHKRLFKKDFIIWKKKIDFEYDTKLDKESITGKKTEKITEKEIFEEEKKRRKGDTNTVVSTNNSNDLLRTAAEISGQAVTNVIDNVTMPIKVGVYGLNLAFNPQLLVPATATTSASARPLAPTPPTTTEVAPATTKVASARPLPLPLAPTPPTATTSASAPTPPTATTSASAPTPTPTPITPKPLPPVPVTAPALSVPATTSTATTEVAPTLVPETIKVAKESFLNRIFGKNTTTSVPAIAEKPKPKYWFWPSSGGGNNKKKLKKNIIRLYNCYILSQNQNGGANNKLSFLIKKKLDKKIAELKFIEGGGFFEDANKLATDANKSITDVTKSAITDANKFLTDTTNSVTSLLTPIDHVWLTNLHNFSKLKTTEATKLLRNATESVTSSFILTEEEKQKKVLIDLIFIEIEKPEIKEQINSLFSLEILKELINNEKENKNFDKFLEITNKIADIRVLIIGSFLKIFVQNLDKKAMEILLLKNQKGGKYNNIVSKYTNDLEGGNLGEFLIYTLPGYGRDITNILGSIIKTIFEGLLFMFQLLGKGVDISKLSETFKILGVIPYILTQVIFNKENFGRALQNNHW